LAYLGRSRSGIDSHRSPLYADEDLELDLDNAVYALDASTIDLRLSVFPWALVRSTESAVKLQTLLDLQGNIPTFIHISDGKLHDVNVFDLLIPEPGAFYIMDRGYVTSNACSRCTEQSVSSSSAPSPIPNTGVATLIPGTNPVVFDAIGPLR